MYCPNTKFSLSLLLLSTSGKSNCLFVKEMHHTMYILKKMVKSYLLFVLIAILFICKKIFYNFYTFLFCVLDFFLSIGQNLKEKKPDNKMYFIPIKSELFHFHLSDRRMFCRGCYKFAFVVILNAPSPF